MLIVESLGRTEKCENVMYNYSYRIIKNQLVFQEEDNLEIQAYGVEVERQDIVDGKVVKIEREVVENVSPHRHKVHNLLKMLCDNLVSPVHLIDILGEYIDNYVNDFDEVLKDIYIC